MNWTKPFSERIIDESARLIDTSENERPIQRFLRDHPYVLANYSILTTARVSLVPASAEVDALPDFLYCDRDSLGFRYLLVELESPTLRALEWGCKSVSAGTHHAVQQIQDYRGWLRANAGSRNRNSSLKSPEDDARATSSLEERTTVGSEDGQRRLADLRLGHIEVTWGSDRLLAEARKPFPPSASRTGTGEEISEEAQEGVAKKAKARGEQETPTIE